jgi:hypothetical protein
MQMIIGFQLFTGRAKRVLQKEAEEKKKKKRRN